MNHNHIALLLSETSYYKIPVIKVIFDPPFKEKTEAFVFLCEGRVEIYDRDYYRPDSKDFNHKLVGSKTECKTAYYKTDTKDPKAIFAAFGVTLIENSKELVA